MLSNRRSAAAERAARGAAEGGFGKGEVPGEYAELPTDQQR